MVTTLCNRKCKHCCNNQYDLNDIPYVTDEELREAHTICITGGEPFMFSDPCAFARYYKYKYPNIQRVFVYTNALELGDYLQAGRKLTYLDGLTISIKNNVDKIAFDALIANNADVLALNSNVLYAFNKLYPNKMPDNFNVMSREWQIEFVAADDSIFRKI